MSAHGGILSGERGICLNNAAPGDPWTGIGHPGRPARKC
jgi:hypothetical protein